MTQAITKPEPPFKEYAVGTRVFFLQPHVWSSCIGDVVEVRKDGVYRVKIYGVGGAVYHGEGYAHQLRPWLWL